MSCSGAGGCPRGPQQSSGALLCSPGHHPNFTAQPDGRLTLRPAATQHSRRKKRARAESGRPGGRREAPQHTWGGGRGSLRPRSGPSRPSRPTKAGRLGRVFKFTCAALLKLENCNRIVFCGRFSPEIIHFVLREAIAKKGTTQTPTLSTNTCFTCEATPVTLLASKSYHFPLPESLPLMEAVTVLLPRGQLGSMVFGRIPGPGLLTPLSRCGARGHSQGHTRASSWSPDLPRTALAPRARGGRCWARGSAFLPP